MKASGKLNTDTLGFTILASVDSAGRYHLLLKEHDISSMEIKLDFTIKELQSAAHWIQTVGDPKAVPVFDNLTRDQREEWKALNFLNFKMGNIEDNPCKEIPEPPTIGGKFTARTLESIKKYVRSGETLEQCAERVWRTLQEYGEHQLKYPQSVSFTCVMPSEADIRLHQELMRIKNNERMTGVEPPIRDHYIRPILSIAELEEANTMIANWEAGRGVSSNNQKISEYVAQYVVNRMNGPSNRLPARIEEKNAKLPEEKA